MTSAHELSFDEILDEILLLEERPSHTVLVRWVKRYPHYSAQLEEFFVTWGVQTEETADSEMETSYFAGLGLARALQLFDHRFSVASVRSLADLTRRLGLSTADLAARCDLDLDFVRQLDSGAIELSTVPERCVEAISSTVDLAPEALLELLVSIQSRKTRKRGLFGPTSRPKISFQDAIEHSSLSPEKKKVWLDLSNIQARQAS